MGAGLPVGDLQSAKGQAFGGLAYLGGRARVGLPLACCGDLVAADMVKLSPSPDLSMIKSLADLLSPHDPALLLAAAAAGERLWLHTDRADAFARLLPWDRLNALITPDRVMAGMVEFARNNTFLPPEMTFRRSRGLRKSIHMHMETLDNFCRQGVSIIINSLQDLDAGIDRMNAILEREFRAPIHTNVYASFSKDSAFNPHWDDHHVLILQLQGRKHWRSWGQPWPSPVPRAEFTVPADPGPPVWEGCLRPGDILYLPRGEIHAARLAEGETSLHLTVGISPPRLKALTAALARNCEGKALTGRQDLPILADAQERDAWMAAAKALLHQAVDELDLDGVLAWLDRERPPLTPGSLGMSRHLTPETRLIPTLRRHGQVPAVEGHILAGDQKWTVNPLEAAILNLLLQHHSLALAELLALLPDNEEGNTRQTVSTLAGKGLLIARSAD